MLARGNFRLRVRRPRRLLANQKSPFSGPLHSLLLEDSRALPNITQHRHRINVLFLLELQVTGSYITDTITIFVAAQLPAVGPRQLARSLPGLGRDIAEDTY